VLAQALAYCVATWLRMGGRWEGAQHKLEQYQDALRGCARPVWQNCMYFQELSSRQAPPVTARAHLRSMIIIGFYSLTVAQPDSGRAYVSDCACCLATGSFHCRLCCTHISIAFRLCAQARRSIPPMAASCAHTDSLLVLPDLCCLVLRSVCRVQVSSPRALPAHDELSLSCLPVVLCCVC
jgi:hypothetical protein